MAVFRRRFDYRPRRARLAGLFTPGETRVTAIGMSALQAEGETNVTQVGMLGLQAQALTRVTQIGAILLWTEAPPEPPVAYPGSYGDTECPHGSFYASISLTGSYVLTFSDRQGSV